MIAALLLAILFKSCRQGLADSQIWKFGTWLGLLLFLGFLSQMSALDEIDPGTSAFLTSLYVVLTALFTTCFEAKKPAKFMWVAVGLATFGASFISGPPHLSWGTAELITVICAFVFALHIVYTQKATKIAPRRERLASSNKNLSQGAKALQIATQICPRARKHCK